MARRIFVSIQQTRHYEVEIADDFDLEDEEALEALAEDTGMLETDNIQDDSVIISDGEQVIYSGDLS